jgi:hypothetical protein
MVWKPRQFFCFAFSRGQVRQIPGALYADVPMKLVPSAHHHFAGSADLISAHFWLLFNHSL